MTCTEHPKCMKDLRASLDKQLASCSAEGKPFLGSIEAVELEWGEEGFTRSKLAQQDVPPFDAIILAELVYNTLYHDVLLWTLGRFSRPETVRAGWPDLCAGVLRDWCRSSTAGC